MNNRLYRIKNMIANSTFAIEPKFMNLALATLNSFKKVSKKETNNDYDECHGYEVIDGVAVISVDGATVKKNSFVNAECGGFIGYDTISNYLSQANNDDSIHTILLHIDSVGGEVAGVDNLMLEILDSSKKVVTLYDNIGASAAIWYGTASSEVFATSMTEIGSIGVMAGYYEPREDDERIVLVSQNAENKDCSLKGDCKIKIQSKINEVEDIFIKRVVDNTGLTKEEITKYFNFGETISSDLALEIGFLDGITTKSKLIQNLASMPSSEKIALNKKGVNLETAKKESKVQADIKAKNKELVELKSSLKKHKSHKKAEKALAKDRKKVIKTALAMGLSVGASSETIIEASLLKNVDEVKKFFGAKKPNATIHIEEKEDKELSSMSKYLKTKDK